MGLSQRTDLKEYWSMVQSDDQSFFRSLFSKDRFLQIFRMLHVGDTTSTLKKDKIKPLLDIIIPVFQATFTPSKLIAIDQSVISFKRRASHCQYLKGKPHPWVIKAFVLADSGTGYLYVVIIYYGKEMELVRPDLPHTA